MNYEHAQIQRVIDAGPEQETGGVFRLKITGHLCETKWLGVTDAQVREIQEVLARGQES